MRRLVLAILLLPLAALAGSAPAQRTLTIEDRVAAQKAIEQVYWSHRIWPKDNPGAKPPLSAVMPDETIRAKVEDGLRKSSALERIWRRPIEASQLQAELDRMARDSNDRTVLSELFHALNDDPYVIAETLARATLSERLIRSWHAGDEHAPGESSGESFDTWWARTRKALSMDVAPTKATFALPKLDPSPCTRDTWRATRTEVPDGRSAHTAVWTGSEMIVWGGVVKDSYPPGISVNTGGRYDPATDTWTSISVGANVPSARNSHSAVWTGTEMIIWGGGTSTSPTTWTNNGALYDPASDSWTATSVAGAPTARTGNTTIWTGSEMIVWGGTDGNGGRYDPVADTWRPTASGANAPSPRSGHTAIWTGAQMIVWGGKLIGPGTDTSSGGRYDPSSDSWLPTSMDANVPSARDSHTAIWTGTEMIVWGGSASGVSTKTGGRYNPTTDSWFPTSVGANVPAGGSGYSAVWTGSKMLEWVYQGSAYDPTTDSWTPMALNLLVPSASGPSVVWTGSEMIEWGGGSRNTPSVGLNTGARYNPVSNSWVPTALSATVPMAAEGAVSVWTGSEMIVWGGYNAVFGHELRTGGRYDPATDSWTPTSQGANVPSARDYHSGVWTGTEMIVWGGNPYTNTGGRYDPATNSWTRTSTGANAPLPRYYHAAVWTGTEMIVWGGAVSGGVLNTGGRYTPATDTWTPTSTGANVPSPRSSHTAIWTGSEMIVWGGAGASDYPIAGGRYDPVADTWTPTSIGANVPVGRHWHAAVWTGTEMIVWGGYNGSDLNSGGRYAPATDTWTATSIGANVPSPRSLSLSAWTGGEMVVFGGAAFVNAVRAIGGARYAPSFDAWIPMTDWPFAGHSIVDGTASTDGRTMMVWGGEPATATGGVYCACPVQRLFFRDADGDGFGDAAVSIVSCDAATPAGYADAAGDCDDSNPAVHPGAVDVCNGLDDDCDGIVDNGANAVTPSELGVSVAVALVDSGARISWSPSAGAATSSVLRGLVSALPVGSAPSSESCLANRIPTATTIWSDADVPPTSDAFWYLVRGENACGAGPYGYQGVSGVPTWVETSPACP